MKKQEGLRKLQLVRETLCPMQNDELEGVYGGSTPSTIVPVSIAASRMSSAACIRASTEGVKYTARMTSRISTVLSVAWSLVHRSEHCGPTQGGPQAPAPPQRGQTGGEGQ